MIHVSQFDGVMINSSSGKDSQTSLRRVLGELRQAQYPMNRVVVAHADLGQMEWPGARKLAEEQAKHYGLSFEVESYRDRHGDHIDLLEYVRRRGKWPSNAQRFCTSEFKRSPCGRVLTRLHRRVADRGRSKILNIFGFRAEESPARAKRKPFVQNKRFSTKRREVWDWLPIHEMKEQAVWDDIEDSGVPHHPAYDLGMPRLSCRFCIFAPSAALMIAGREAPALLDQYVQLEQEIRHDFKHKQPIGEIRDALRRGESADLASLDGNWNM